MTISSELETQIARYYYVEKWRIGSIAKQLNVHHCTVKRVLSKKGVEQTSLVSQKSMVDPYLPFMLEQLQKYPNLTARRLYDMACERGYPGGPDHFRHVVALHRPKPAAEAYLRLRTLPGEQAQVDWGHFGYVTIGKAKRPVMAFVMVLSYSRKLFLRFYLNQRMENFLRGHKAAFTQFGGVPRVLLYDNLKSAVLERKGDAIRFHPTLLELSAHYRFEPRPVAVARGNEKGRVERAIRYVRDNFFAARHWEDLEDLNAQATAWCNGPASNRPCPEEKAESVQAVFLQEQPKLIALPDNPYPCEETQTIKSGKTPYVRFDLNDYSIPHTYVRQPLTLTATLTSIRISKGMDVIAEHVRSYDKGQQIENSEHIQEQVNRKKKAKEHRAQDRLTTAVANGAEFLKQAASQGYHLASTSNQLLNLLEDYGAIALHNAIEVALAQQSPHPNTVQMQLEKQRKRQHKQPPVGLPKDKRARELVIQPHTLEAYDQLQSTTTSKTQTDAKPGDTDEHQKH